MTTRSDAATKLRDEFSLRTIGRLYNLRLGSDPEFFFSTPKRGIIRGAERVIPKDGIKTDPYYDEPQIVLDGVQAELHPRPHECRELVGNEIRSCFRLLKRQMEKSGTKLQADFSPVVEISPGELRRLSDQAKKFGCAPSFNEYDDKDPTIDIDAATCTTRCAGGHIHLGVKSDDVCVSSALNRRKELVPVLDILLGNTCVLLDKNPLIAERRKVYGRAGEYRTPPHGLEYRVLSNFWLKSYPMASFVMNMARFCVAVVSHGENYVKALKSLVNMDDIVKAINENDFDLALKNFNKVSVFFEAIDIDDDDGYDCIYKNDGPSEAAPFTFNCIDEFLFFVSKGVDYWFDADIMGHWCNLPDAVGGRTGWEHFMLDTVMPEYDDWDSNGRPALSLGAEALK